MEKPKHDREARKALIELYCEDRRKKKCKMFVSFSADTDLNTHA